MSLFPAYSGLNSQNLSVNTGPGGNNEEWLTNTSFNVGTSTLGDQNIRYNNVRSHKKVKRLRKDSKKRNRNVKRWYKKRNKLKAERLLCEEYLKNNPVVDLISEQCDLYCIDKTKRMEYLYCSTLTKPLKPWYRADNRLFIGPEGMSMFQEPKKEKNSKRYFMMKSEIKKKEQEEKDNNVLKVIRKAEKFNRTLTKESSVSEWMEFIEFQDEFFTSQNITYKTEGDREKAIKTRKLDILQRAMNFNPENEELLNYWMKIGSEIFSSHEMSASLEEMIESSPGRLSLWLSLISVRQHSLALCSFSSVTELYKKAINSLKSVKTDELAQRDSDILELLFQYCKFLQDCGHWEALWTIFKNNIKLNFGFDLDIDVGITDIRVKQLEDNIISVDKQPIWITWRLVETLREGLHFLPTDTVYYPQRCVFLNDVLDFILHFHRDIHFKFIIKFFMLLKVPLLPCNTAVLKALSCHTSIFTLDSPELILSTAFSAPASGVKIDYLKFVTQVSAGPQYLRNREGQQEFLELIQKTFQECMQILEGKKKTFLGLWCLRFNRWLSILDKHSLATFPPTAKNKKNFFKDFMKHPENRNNLLYYCEYSLFEYNQGNIEASIRTLKTLISARQSVNELTDELEKAGLCQAYRCLSELFLEIGRKEEAMKILIDLAVGSLSNPELRTVKVALNKYESHMFNLLKEIACTSDSLELILMPQFSLEWIHCYLWLSAISDSAACAKSLYQRFDSKLKCNENSFSNYAREYLCEATAVILWKLGESNPQPLIQTVKDGLKQFPYNLKLLSLLASKKLEEHGLWWTFKQSFLNPPTVFGCVILICVALARKEIDEESFGNRLKSLFRQLALDEGRLSSIVHRLRMIFLFDFDHSLLDSAHMNAIESCPWNKSVYTSAVSVLPNKLMELTDIMIEKELRIHVTPEEIEEMRD